MLPEKQTIGIMFQTIDNRITSRYYDILYLRMTSDENYMAFKSCHFTRSWNNVVTVYCTDPTDGRECIFGNPSGVLFLPVPSYIVK